MNGHVPSTRRHRGLALALPLALALAACTGVTPPLGPPPSVTVNYVNERTFGGAAPEVSRQAQVYGLLTAGGASVVSLQGFVSDPGGANPVKVYDRPFAQPAGVERYFTVTADVSAAADGDRDLYFRAVDALGRSADSSPVRVTVVNTPPTVDSFTADPPEVQANQPSTLTWTVRSAGKVELAVSPNPNASFTPTGMVVRVPTTTTFTLSATNAAGRTTRTVTLTVR